MSKKDKWLVALFIGIVVAVISVMGVLFVPHCETYNVAFCDIRLNEENEPYMLVTYYNNQDVVERVTKGLQDMTEFERAYFYGGEDLSIKTSRLGVAVYKNKVGNVSFNLIGD